MSGEVRLRVVRGEPTAEQVAALLVALAAVRPAAEPEPAEEPFQWGAPGRAVRQPLAPTGWWQSSLPR